MSEGKIGCFSDVEQVFVLELDVLLFLRHFSELQQVDHVFFSEKPREKLTEDQLNFLFFGTLSLDQICEKGDSENFLFFLPVEFIHFLVRYTDFLAHPSDSILVHLIQEKLNHLLCDVATDVLLVDVVNHLFLFLR